MTEYAFDATGLLARSHTLPSTGYPTYTGYPTVFYPLAHCVRVLALPWFVIGRSRCVRDGVWCIGRSSHVRKTLILHGSIREISLFLPSQ